MNTNNRKFIEALDLKPGMVVADVGAGSGYFTRRLAKAVGETGQVLAVDVEQKMLDFNKQELDTLGISKRASFILAKPDDPSLPQNSVDLVFLCNAYHHVEHHADYWAKIKSALKPNGRVVIINFYHDERSGKLGFSKHLWSPENASSITWNRPGILFPKKIRSCPVNIFWNSSITSWARLVVWLE